MLIEERRDAYEYLTAPKWLPRQPLTLSIVVDRLSVSDLGAEPHYYANIFEFDWEEGRPTLMNVGYMWKMSNDYAHTWGPNGEWYIVEEYPGLLAYHFTLPRNQITLGQLRLGNETILIDDPPIQIMMPDWTP